MIKETIVSICSLLNKHHVEYLIIGGVAVIFHGYTRATADIDFWYKPSLTNFHKVIKTFKEYGVDVSELETMVFKPEEAFLRFPTFGLKAEFLPAIPGNIVFDDAVKRSQVIVLEGVTIPVIGYEDLVKNKSATNRLKDQADIEELSKRKDQEGANEF